MTRIQTLCSGNGHHHVANGVVFAPSIRETSEFSFSELNSDYYEVKLKLNKILAAKNSRFQRLEIIETAQFGKTLVMDGKTQSAACDEYMYHEALVQPAMLARTDTPPKTVFIGGGAEFATAREILRHECVEKVVMVDLDEDACQLCKEHMAEWNQGCVNDPRLEVYHTDAMAFLENYDGKFDVIILDLCDPIEAGPAYKVYSREFYGDAKEKLKPNGILITQAGASSLYNFQECFTAIHQTLKQCFESVHAYSISIPSFSGDWGYVIAFKDADDSCFDFANRDPIEIDKAVKARNLEGKLRFYDGISHRHMFALPKPIREGLKREDRVITLDNPVFMY